MLRPGLLQESLVGVACLLVGLADARAGVPTIAPASAASAASAGPLNDLRQMDRALEAALRRRVPDWSPEASAIRIRVDAILAEALDYEQIAHRALDDDWDKLTAAQRRDFLRTFTALTNQAFVSAVTRPNVRLRFDSESITGLVASVLVTACVSGATTPDTEQPIEYRLAKKGSRWMVYDVVVDRVSLVDSYRREFARVLHRGGFAELMARMQYKLERSEKY